MLIVNDNAPHNYNLLTPAPVIRTPFEYLYSEPKLAAIELDEQENFNQIKVSSLSLTTHTFDSSAGP